ncbi:transport ATP-binding protein CydD [Desulfocucumis palustris]|uniref:Transport ATP-binding protein CydD n=1 Tax=Desulfocucumis palustris TaxID=1898651 RepID=A0A2L2XMY8_9FIRM|nr:thiol reductant ABC exporter subunit CydD [Desulfocucumis palustris]GBF35716.1 transport ATP-binding protein CydD [Desulfocucumis palustris]
MLDKRLFGETGPVRVFLALSVGLGLGSGLLAVLQAGCLARVVNRVFLNGNNLEDVRALLGVLLGLIIFRAGLAWIGEIAAHRAAAGIKHRLRQRLLAHLLALGPVYAGGERTGELVNVLVEGIEALDAYFARYLPQLALAALLPLAVLGFVFPLDIVSGLILLFTAPLIPLFMFLIGKWAQSLSRRQWEALSLMSAHFLDVLQGLTTLKIFGRSKEQAKTIARISGNFRDTTLGVLRVAFLSALALEFVATISTALVAVTVGLRLVYARIPFEQAFFLLLLAPEFYLPLRLLGGNYHAGLAGVSAAGRIFEILDTPPPPETKSSPPSPVPPGPPFRITFEDVHFSYGQGERTALQGVSFGINPGEMVALVGPSGAGKTTAAHLLLRFIEPDRGRILVNGTPLGQMPQEEWRRHIALIPQKPYLFYGTIADNIRLGRPGAALEEVMEAAVQAGGHGFILDLPRGYDTQVGEGGIRLSGGQVQRLAIARAFLKDAPLLIMDEATGGLDPVSESVILESLERLARGRTALIIAHRLHTVRRAGRIVVLESGRVAETGRHQELLEMKGIYHRLVSVYPASSL